MFFFFLVFIQDSTSLPGVLVLEEMEEMEVNDKVKEEARVSVEHFLQVREITRLGYVDR